MSLVWTEVRIALDKLEDEFHWASHDFDSSSGRRYRAGSGTLLSAYHAGTDVSGTVEIALAAHNLAKRTGRDPGDVFLWIHGLQTTFGAYARPTTRYKYPRVAVSSVRELPLLGSGKTDFT